VLTGSAFEAFEAVRDGDTLWIHRPLCLTGHLGHPPGVRPLLLVLLTACRPPAEGPPAAPAPDGGGAGTGGGDTAQDTGGFDDTGAPWPTWEDPLVAGTVLDLEVGGPELTDAVRAEELLLFAGQEQSGDGGIWVFDLADPDVPVLRGKTSTWHIQRLCWSGEVALGMTREGTILQVTPTDGDPVIDAEWRDGTVGEGIACEGELVAAALGSDGLRVYERDPGVSLTATDQVEGTFRDALLEDGRLWGLASDALTAWSLADGVLTEEGSLELPGSCTDLAAHEDWLAVACGSGGVVLVDRGEGSPSILGSWEGHASARAVAVSEDHVLVAAWTDLLLVDVSDPAAPWLRATEPARSAVMAVVEGPERRAYVADWNQPFVAAWDEVEAPELRMGATTVLPGDTVRIRNDGPVVLELGAPSVGSLEAETVAPGGSTTWSIPAEATGELSLASSDPDEPEVSLSVSDGTGISIGAEAPDFVEQDLETTTWQLSALRGEVVFLGLFTDG